MSANLLVTRRLLTFSESKTRFLMAAFCLKIVEENQRPRLLPGTVGVFGRTVGMTRRIQVIAHYRKATTRQAALGLLLVLLLAAFGLTESRTALRGQDAEVKDKPPAKTPATTVKIAGVCRDENGKPLKDVHVALYQVDYRKLSRGATARGCDRRRGTFYAARFARARGPKSASLMR